MLDTQSNVSYARRAITERRIKKDYETNEISGLHQTASGGDFTYMTIDRGHQLIKLDTRCMNEAMFGNCVALLGCPHIDQLGISLDYLMAHDDYQEILFYDLQIPVEKRLLNLQHNFQKDIPNYTYSLLEFQVKKDQDVYEEQKD